MASVNAEPASPKQQQLHCCNKIQRFNFIPVSQYAGRWPEAEQQWGQWWRTGLCQECLKEHISKVKQHNRQLLMSSAKVGYRVFVVWGDVDCNYILHAVVVLERLRFYSRAFCYSMLIINALILYFILCFVSGGLIQRQLQKLKVN